MTDLVKDLRTGRGLNERKDENGHVWRDAWVHKTMLSAADRIEEVEAQLKAQVAVTKDLERENADLRAALDQAHDQLATLERGQRFE